MMFEAWFGIEEMSSLYFTFSATEMPPLASSPR